MDGMKLKKLVLSGNKKKTKKRKTVVSDSNLTKKDHHINIRSLTKFSSTLDSISSGSKSFINPKNILKPINSNVLSPIRSNLVSPYKTKTYTYTLPFIKNSKIFTTSKVDLFTMDIGERTDGIMVHKYFRPKACEFLKNRVVKGFKRINRIL